MTARQALPIQLWPAVLWRPVSGRQDAMVCSPRKQSKRRMPSVCEGIRIRDDEERRNTEIGVLAMRTTLLARPSAHLGSSTAWELEYLAGKLIQLVLATGADRQ